MPRKKSKPKNLTFTTGLPDPSVLHGSGISFLNVDQPPNWQVFDKKEYVSPEPKAKKLSEQVAELETIAEKAKGHDEQVKGLKAETDNLKNRLDLVTKQGNEYKSDAARWETKYKRTDNFASKLLSFIVFYFTLALGGFVDGCKKQNIISHLETKVEQYNQILEQHPELVPQENGNAGARE
jgi:outer membrane murein-binding lipoprotein Lpp